jgi:hypothetical protein
MALADYILAIRKNTFECEGIIAVLDAHFIVTGKMPGLHNLIYSSTLTK